MSIFAGDPAKLDETVDYELFALEYLRATLFCQSEQSDDYTIATIGDVTPEGFQRLTHGMTCHVSISGDAVREALARFRPLAFGSGYKLQDMVVEWILWENGCTGKGDRRFQQKLLNYDRLATTTLLEPEYFVQQPHVGKAFWELFRYFEPYRHALIHAGGIRLAVDGALEISRPKKPLLRLSPTEQAAYIRAMCLIVVHLTGRIKLDAHLSALVESDLASLSAYHSVTALRARVVRLTRLKVIAPEDQLISVTPLAVRVDFAQLRNLIERSISGGADGRVFFSAIVEAIRSDSISRWELPLEAVPAGVVELREGDPRFDPFLSHQVTGSPSL